MRKRAVNQSAVTTVTLCNKSCKNSVTCMKHLFPAQVSIGQLGFSCSVLGSAGLGSKWRVRSPICSMCFSVTSGPPEERMETVNASSVPGSKLAPYPSHPPIPLSLNPFGQRCHAINPNISGQGSPWFPWRGAGVKRNSNFC